MSAKVEQLPVLHRAAGTEPGTIDEAGRSVEVVWTTGARVRRSGFIEAFDEDLQVTSDAVRMGRLMSGKAPLLDTHNDWSLDHQIGVVEKAWLDGGSGRARIRFADVPSVAETWEKVRQGIVANISVGYIVHRYIEQQRDGMVPLRTAIDWEPVELSLVPVPADPTAHVRSKSEQLHPCEISGSGAPPAAEQKDAEMAKAPAAAVEDAAVIDPPKTDAAEATRAAQPSNVVALDEGAIRADAARQAREHIAALMARGSRLGASPALVQRAIGENWTLDRLTDAYLDARVVDQEQTQGRGVATNPDADGARPHASVRAGSYDENEVQIAGIEGALVEKISSGGIAGGEKSARFRHMPVWQMLRCRMEIMGVRGLDILGPDEIVRRASHTTSDFPLILANATGKVLLPAYQAAPMTWKRIAKRFQARDFRPIKPTRLSQGPVFQRINEHGEFKSGTLIERGESFAVATYGREISITRQALINDDLNAFSDLAANFANAAANIQANIVYYLLLSNPALSDTVALFNSAHGNLAGTGSAIATDKLGDGRAAMAKQMDGDGETPLNIAPDVLLVPPTLVTVAKQYTGQTIQMRPGKPSDAPTDEDANLSVISEARLETGVTLDGSTAAGSNKAWYLFSSNPIYAVIGYAYLGDQETPIVDTMPEGNILGTKIRAYIDFGAGLIDYKGAYKNAGP